MLTVIKRSGKEEPFDSNKLKKTVIAAGDEIKHPFNESDVNILTGLVARCFDGRDKVTSKEVYNALIDCLRSESFEDVAEAYINFADNSWI